MNNTGILDTTMKGTSVMKASIKFKIYEAN